jgi:hypothetical protein
MRVVWSERPLRAKLYCANHSDQRLFQMSVRPAPGTAVPIRTAAGQVLRQASRR